MEYAIKLKLQIPILRSKDLIDFRILYYNNLITTDMISRFTSIELERYQYFLQFMSEDPITPLFYTRKNYNINTIVQSAQAYNSFKEDPQIVSEQA